MPRGHEGPVATQADAPLPPTWQSDKWGRIRELRKKRKQTNQIGKQEIEKGGCRLSGRKALERPGTTIAVRASGNAAATWSLAAFTLTVPLPLARSPPLSNSLPLPAPPVRQRRHHKCSIPSIFRSCSVLFCPLVPCDQSIKQIF